MKMCPELEKAFNNQFLEEITNWYNYSAIAQWFTNNNLNGFASWMRLQAAEELTHADRLRKYMEVRDNTVHYGPITTPTTSWQKPLEVVKAVYALEVSGSASIIKMAQDAFTLGDLGAYTELQWFMTEQEEEEEQVRDIIEKMELVGESNHTLYLLDKEMKKRLV